MRQELKEGLLAEDVGIDGGPARQVMGDDRVRDIKEQVAAFTEAACTSSCTLKIGYEVLGRGGVALGCGAGIGCLAGGPPGAVLGMIIGGSLGGSLAACGIFEICRGGVERGQRAQVVAREAQAASRGMDVLSGLPPELQTMVTDNLVETRRGPAA